MAGDGIEWFSDDRQDDSAEEELAVGRSLVPERISVRARAFRATSTARALLVLGVLVLVVVVLHETARGPAAHRATPVQTIAPADVKQPLTPFDRVLALALTPQLVNHIRQSSPPGGCATVAVGHSPERAVLAALRAYVGHLRSRDSARTLDQFTGLCSLQLRASMAGHVVVTITVIAPPARPAHSTLDAVEVGVQTADGVTTTYAEEHRHDGWIVLVGATGRGSGVPPTHELAAVAADPRVVW